MSQHDHDYKHEHQQGQGNCRDLLLSLSEYVDGELGPELCVELERHLRDCNRCRVVVDTLKKTVELYHDHTDEAPLPNEVRSRLFVRLDLLDFRKDDSLKTSDP